MTKKKADSIISALLAMRSEATDSTASNTAALYYTLKNNGELIKAGTRINYKGVIKRAVSDLWDRAENTPENAPTLWEDIEYKDGYRIIPEVITVGTAFSLGEIGWWNNALYESLMDANVYTPEQYPQGWQLYNSTNN